ncbi:MAG: lytic transglycosylase domain-containing protein [Deltaproteobacteria bacterium]|nr:lytic transglycosylase domain-containing protein [Deltaproteobacteria bacterium]
MSETSAIRSNRFRNKYTDYRRRNDEDHKAKVSKNSDFSKSLSKQDKSGIFSENDNINQNNYEVLGQKAALETKEGSSIGNSYETPQEQQLGTTMPPMPLPNAGSGSNRMLNKLSQYEGHIKAAAARYNLPEELIAGIIWQESRGNMRARSHCGAMGLMQLMPGTAQQLGVASPYDPAQNIDGGAKYIRQMINKFGRVDHAVAAYNAGPGNVQKHGGVPPFKETQNYVPKVLGYAQSFRVAGGFPTRAPSNAVMA